MQGGRRSSDGSSGDGRATIPPRSVSVRDDAGEIIRIGDRALKIGSLPKKAISDVVHQHWGEVEGCYKVRKGQHPRSAGTVSVGFTIDGTGNVKEVGIAETTLHDSEVEACLLSAVHTWTFPMPLDGGDVSVIYPWTFRPSAN
jgi:TonB family protein